MIFTIHMGVPEMRALWDDLLARGQRGKLSGEERIFFNKWSKALDLLSGNPRHPGLRTHEIDDLSRKFGVKVWQSYLKNRKSDALRMFWAYGPQRHDITILAVERHPDTGKRKVYERIPLSRFPSSPSRSQGRN
ncbi:MAG: hypothetical protein HUU04_05895 [Verrucomicrobiae bacterium]|nr:hypothetical protein [Verrucomicrobiae bacterium]